MTIRISLSTVLVALVLLAIGAGTAVGVMLWEPWDGDKGNTKGSEGSATLLCEDALERRRATEDALQRPVLESQAPLSIFRGSDTYTSLSDEVIRLESKLRDIEREIERFCE